MSSSIDVISAIWANTSTEELGRVMGRATAPVFLLTAVASFISVLMTRLTRIVDRIRMINGIPIDDVRRSFLREDLPRLQKRAGLVHRAISLALASGLATTMIVIFMFTGAALGIRHEFGSALLFVGTQALFAGSLFNFAREIQIGLADADSYE